MGVFATWWVSAPRYAHFSDDELENIPVCVEAKGVELPTGIATLEELERRSDLLSACASEKKRIHHEMVETAPLSYFLQPPMIFDTERRSSK